MSAVATATAVRVRPAGQVVRDYVALTKPRVILLLEITTLFAMIVAAHGWPGTVRVILTLAGGYLAAGSANAINCWFDRDIDRTMGRTRNRPLPSGRIQPASALGFGLVLGVLSFLVLGLGVNLVAAVLAQVALLFYVLVYTMVLKRSSPQNIVIGGAAGAIPPMVGVVAVTGGVNLTSIFLFAIIFYWTPPHFWALSLLIRRDYQQAGVPMLPVVAGERFTHINIVMYSVVLAAVTMLPVVTRTFGLAYLAGAAVLDAWLIVASVRLWRRPTARGARRLYYYSLLYLALLFAVTALDSVVRIG